MATTAKVYLGSGLALNKNFQTRKALARLVQHYREQGRKDRAHLFSTNSCQRRERRGATDGRIVHYEPEQVL